MLVNCTLLSQEEQCSTETSDLALHHELHITFGMRMNRNRSSIKRPWDILCLIMQT
jgi:hypothetical protein